MVGGYPKLSLPSSDLQLPLPDRERLLCSRCGIDRLCSRGEIMTGVRLSLKTINSELERLGSHAMLAKGDGYFYFLGGEATDWFDRTVRVPTLHSLTLEQWIEQYRIFKEKNRALLKGGMAAGKPEAEHSDRGAGGLSSDRHQKRRRVPPPPIILGSNEGGVNPGNTRYASQRPRRSAETMAILFRDV
jgi:hypothetical protein